jgi:hypothetical protein
MFGYIRPLKDELKVREFEQYKSCYCALCHTLKSRYGAFARNILTYDFTFLAMLLWETEDTPEYRCVRCLASPLKKIKTCAPSRVLDLCAGYSVILAYWKLRDSAADEGLWKSLRDRALLVLLTRAYKKASASYPAYTETVRLNLEALRLFEAEDGAPPGVSRSLDEFADKFARVTEALASLPENDAGYRPLRQILYHAGRAIYILDAFDDLRDDMQKGRFNPLARRFNITEGKLSDADLERLRSTILHSLGLMGTAYELLSKNSWSSILSNIIYLGIPEICCKVLDGTWKSREGARI